MEGVRTGIGYDKPLQIKGLGDPTVYRRYSSIGGRREGSGRRMSDMAVADEASRRGNAPWAVQSDWPGVDGCSLGERVV